jgi:hypothetical protein
LPGAAPIAVDRFPRHLQRAVQALDLADRLTDTVRPSRREAAIDAAFAVYGQGLFWALSAEAPGDLPATLDEAFEAAPPDLLGAASADGDIARARRLVAGPAARADDQRESETLADLAALRSTLQSLICALRRRRPTSGAVARRRWTRVAVAMAIAAAPIFLVVRHLLDHDLAAGRPWLTSSTEPDCNVSAGICRGQAVSLYFHTQTEASPWARVDLGSVQPITTITVVNRRDCCAERAVPLILEVGDDGARFTQVAEQKAQFIVWNAKFPEVRARYLRVRVPAVTALHLERVSVR